jgi:hypothetical protein
MSIFFTEDMRESPGKLVCRDFVGRGFRSQDYHMVAERCQSPPAGRGADKLPAIIVRLADAHDANLPPEQLSV